MIATIVIVLILLLILGTLFDGYFIVRTREAAILERLGKFQKVALAGLHFKLPWVDRVRDKISLQVRQLDVMVETKTKDNVFVQIPVAVQYEVVEGREREAYYMLSNHEQQIVAYVQDNVRSSVANMDLDDSFSSKDTIARNVAASLRDNMAEYGWNFVNTLVTDIRPDSRVRESMNSINAAQREREAAVAQAEAEKIRVVKEAEGAAEAKKLQGRGVADQRKEIVEGIAQQYEMLRDAGVEESPEALMLVSQCCTCPPTRRAWVTSSAACATCSWPTAPSTPPRGRLSTAARSRTSHPAPRKSSASPSVRQSVPSAKPSLPPSVLSRSAPSKIAVSNRRSRASTPPRSPRLPASTSSSCATNSKTRTSPEHR